MLPCNQKKAAADTPNRQEGRSACICSGIVWANSRSTDPGPCTRLGVAPKGRGLGATPAPAQRSAKLDLPNGADPPPSLGVPAICAAELFLRSRDHGPRLCRLQRAPPPPTRRARRGRHRRSGLPIVHFELAAEERAG